jgi:hypothetical protein
MDITTKGVSLNPANGEVYSIQHYTIMAFLGGHPELSTLTS